MLCRNRMNEHCILHVLDKKMMVRGGLKATCEFKYDVGSISADDFLITQTRIATAYAIIPYHPLR